MHRARRSIGMRGDADRFLRSASTKRRNRHGIGDGFLYSWCPHTDPRCFSGRSRDSHPAAAAARRRSHKPADRSQGLDPTLDFLLRLVPWYTPHS